ncbi:MAG TPA: hypothetical protein VH142_03900 [Polyangiaceae bacterium]|nr:hypothetical protein [Polyangiaceae bacterium]
MTDPPTPLRRRTPLSFRALSLAMLALAVVVLSVGGELYFKFVYYDRIASSHVPASAAFALRLDVSQAVFYEPVRRYFLPMLGGPGLPLEQGDEHITAIEHASGLLRSDLREVVFAGRVGFDDWVIVLNGLFPKDTPSSGLVPTLATEPGWTHTGAIAVSARGVVVGRAGDGVVLIASSKAWFDEAATGSGGADALGLKTAGAGSFGLGREALGRLARTPAVLATGDLAGLYQQLTGVRGSLGAGERIEARAAFSAPDARVARQAAEETLAMLRALSRSVPTALGGALLAGVERSSVQSDEGTDPVLVVTWERIEADRALAALAESSRR